VTLNKLALVILIFIYPGYSYTNYNNTMNDFIGANIDMSLYLDHYWEDGSQDPDYEVAAPFRWVRIYHRWDWFEEPFDDNYTFNTVNWKDMDDFHTKLDQDSVNILIAVELGVSWLGVSGNTPYDNGDGSSENHYRQRAEYLAQLAARYGYTVHSNSNYLETPDKVSGLGIVKYFEDFNEEDQWWSTPAWHPYDYGKYLNAVHDGQGVTTDSSLPLAGIKQGDPAAVHVMGGMAKNGLESTPAYSGSYLQAAVDSAGRNAFDIINFHQYWHDGSRGVSPEYGILEANPERINDLIAWRDANAPGCRIWLTEFGWDTYDSSGTHSHQWAPELQQANYLMRAFALLKHAGIDKAFMFMLEDFNSSGTTQYDSCGVMSDSYQHKISYYYLSTMRHSLGQYVFTRALQHAQGSPQRFLYEFSKPGDQNQKAYMLWCRQSGSKFDNNTTVNNYNLSLSNITNCQLITCQDNNLTGVKSNLTITDPGLATASVTVPLVSETPVFLQTVTEYIYTGPLVSFNKGPSANTTTNSPFVIKLTVDKEYGYWSTNSSPFSPFFPETGSILITDNTLLQYYGEDSGGTNSGMKSVSYTFDTNAPQLGFISGPATYISTNQSFSIELQTSEPSSYWSTNGTAFNSFSNLSGNIVINETVLFSYFSKDKAGNNSTTNINVYHFPDPQIQPTGLNSTFYGRGTNLLTWESTVTNGTFTVYYATSGPINTSNISQAVITETNLNYSQTNYYHILTNIYEKDFYYAVRYQAPAAGGSSAKLNLTTNMIADENGLGDAGLLVDEQGLIGDPPVNDPLTQWFPGWNTADYPAAALLDLGSLHQLDQFYYFDAGNAGNMEFYYGEPGSWSTLGSDDGSGWLEWKNLNTDIQTRYLRIVTLSPEAADSLHEIALYGYNTGAQLYAIYEGINTTLSPAANSLSNLTHDQPPQIDVITPQNNDKVYNTLEIYCTVFDADSTVANVSCSLDQTNWQSMTPAGGYYSGQLDISALDSKFFNLFIKAAAADGGTALVAVALENTNVTVAQVKPLFPSNNTVIRKKSFNYSWEVTGSAADIAAYIIEIDSSTNICFTNYFTAGELASGSHKWRIAALYQNSNTSPWSAYINFTVRLVTNKTIHLYPNPVSLARDQRLYFARPDTVKSFSVYTPSGVLVRKQKNTDYWDLKNSCGITVRPGVYICLISTYQKNIQTKILITR